MRGRIVFIIIALSILSINIIQRIKKTFTKESVKSEKKRYRYLTYLTIFCYLGIFFLGTVEYFIFSKTIQPIITILGICLYFIGYRLTNNAINTLGGAWNIHISAENIKKIITNNIYRQRRHPYYLGSILELLGWLLFLNAYRTIIALFILQLPLYLFRMILEEKELIRKFGKEYIEYKYRTPMF